MAIHGSVQYFIIILFKMCMCSLLQAIAVSPSRQLAVVADLLLMHKPRRAIVFTPTRGMCITTVIIQERIMKRERGRGEGVRSAYALNEKFKPYQCCVCYLK